MVLVLVVVVSVQLCGEAGLMNERGVASLVGA